MQNSTKKLHRNKCRKHAQSMTNIDEDKIELD